VATANEFVADAYPRLAGWVRRQVDDAAAAHEIASEAFVRLLSRWTKVENPPSYLRTTAAKLIRDHESSPARVDNEVAA
jgi:RNA polymerase sigma-70 factor (ECF subfamily)